MTKFLDIIKIVLAYWASTLISYTLRSFCVLEKVPIIERGYLLSAIYAVLFIISVVIIVAIEGAKKNKIGIAVLSVQFVIATLMCLFGRGYIIYVISTPVAMGNYIFSDYCNQFEPKQTFIAFVISALVTFVPIVLGEFIYRSKKKRIEKKSKEAWRE